MEEAVASPSRFPCVWWGNRGRNLGEVCRRDADPLVFQRDFDIFAGAERQDTIGLDQQIFPVNLNGPSRRHGLDGINNEILENLIDLPDIHFQGPEVIGQPKCSAHRGASTGESDAFPDELFDGDKPFIGAPPLAKVSNCRAKFWACKQAFSASINISRPPYSLGDPAWPG